MEVHIRTSKNIEHRAQPRFAIGTWSAHERVVDGLPRTNSLLEGWHRAFQQTVDCHHPSVYKLIDHFRKEQDIAKIRITRLAAGIRKLDAIKTKYGRVFCFVCLHLSAGTTYIRCNAKSKESSKRKSNIPADKVKVFNVSKQTIKLVHIS
ncbi:hypothetical protein AVEN_77035-1 [Araneus ventricosus]|uniref:Uncharacterized protein n=1 Tax=Araneus ventricosus TaxID=182803 RepID=A0A4Y2G4H2_ARAVE|nr:hypothetical protein AVEN_77035-1 [Araneus ventricosus]